MPTVPGARLTRRTLLAAAVTCLLVVLVLVTLVHGTGRLRAAAGHTSHSGRVLSATYDAQQALDDLDAGQRGFLYQRRPHDLETWRRARAELPVRLRRLERIVSDNPVQQARARILAARIQAYVSLWSAPLVAVARRDDDAARTMARTNIGRTQLAHLRAAFSSFAAVEQYLSTRRSEAASDAATRATRLGVAGLLVIVSLLAAFAFYVIRTIVRPVREMADATARVAAGDLSVRVPTGGAGEVGDLGRAFNLMSAELERERDALRELTEQLAASNRDLEDFASVASHDLQEPLRKIRIFADRLATAHADGLGPDGLDLLDRMRRSAGRMQDLIEGLLELSCISTSDRPFTPVDLTDVGHEVVADLETSIEAAEATVELGPLPTLDADPLQMRQLLQNLVSNAIKFRRPDVPPVVRVSTGPNGDGRCRLVVEDNGVGFDPRFAEHIFAVFERLHPRSRYDGSGVGLAVCRRIAERHGGEIAASSDGQIGARFVVTLPLSR